MYGGMPYTFPSQAANVSLLSRIKLGSILSGAQKTLNVVNQAIPLYYQVKPLFKNLKTIGKIGRAFINNTGNTETIHNNINSVKSIKTNDIPTPSFFI